MASTPSRGHGRKERAKKRGASGDSGASGTSFGIFDVEMVKAGLVVDSDGNPIPHDAERIGLEALMLDRSGSMRSSGSTSRSQMEMRDVRPEVPDRLLEDIWSAGLPAEEESGDNILVVTDGDDVPGESVLDRLEREGYKVTGVEISPDALAGPEPERVAVHDLTQDLPSAPVVELVKTPPPYVGEHRVFRRPESVGGDYLQEYDGKLFEVVGALVDEDRYVIAPLDEDGLPRMGQQFTVRASHLSER
jgi:hypothetical protein